MLTLPGKPWVRAAKWAKRQFINSRSRPGCSWEEKGASVPERSPGHPHCDPKPSPHFCRDVSWGQGWGEEASVPLDVGAVSQMSWRAFAGVDQAQITHAELKHCGVKPRAGAAPLPSVAAGAAGIEVPGSRCPAACPGNRVISAFVPLWTGERRPIWRLLPLAENSPRPGSVAAKITTRQRVSPCGKGAQRGWRLAGAAAGSHSRHWLRAALPPLQDPLGELRERPRPSGGVPGRRSLAEALREPGSCSPVWFHSGFPGEGGGCRLGHKPQQLEAPTPARRGEDD